MRILSSLRLSPIAAAPLLLLPTAFGQATDADVINLAYGAGSGSSSSAPIANQSLVGDLSGDGVPDLVWVGSGRAGVFINPSFADSVVLGHANVSGGAIYPKSQFHDEETLYLTNNIGLTRNDYNNDIHPVSWDTTVLSSGAWAGATRLQTAQLHTSTGTDLLAVASDGRGILIAYDAPFGLMPSHTPVFSTIGVVDDLVACRLNGSADEYIVASTSHGLEIYDRFGAQKATFPDPDKKGHVAVISAIDGSERVAWLRNRAGNKRLFSLIGSTFQQSNLLLLHGSARVMRSGDYDNDGDDDLILARAQGKKLWLIRNNSGVFSVPDDGNEIWDASKLAQGSHVAPFMGDLDGDGDGDLAMILTNEEVVHMRINSAIVSQKTGTPQVIASEAAANTGRQLWYEQLGTDFTLHMRIAKSVSAPAGANAIQAFLWESADSDPSITGHSLATNPTPGSERLFDLVNDLTSHPNLVGSFYKYEAPIFNGLDLQQDICYVSMRYVEIDWATTEVLHSWPMNQLYLVGPDDTITGAPPASLSYVEGLPFTDNATGIPWSDPLSGQDGSGDTAGSGAGSRCCPDYPVGCPPQDPPPGSGN